MKLLIRKDYCISASVVIPISSSPTLRYWRSTIWRSGWVSGRWGSWGLRGVRSWRFGGAGFVQAACCSGGGWGTRWVQGCAWQYLNQMKYNSGSQILTIDNYIYSWTKANTTKTAPFRSSKSNPSARNSTSKSQPLTSSTTSSTSETKKVPALPLRKCLLLPRQGQRPRHHLQKHSGTVQKYH